MIRVISTSPYTLYTTDPPLLNPICTSAYGLGQVRIQITFTPIGTILGHVHFAATAASGSSVNSSIVVSTF